MSNRLAEELQRIRRIKGLSLRDIERETKISNAYLSQLERGEATNPSAQKLYKLAKFYEVPYELLLEWAGYTSMEKGANKFGAVEVALMSAKLDTDEQEKVLEYIEFLRVNRNRGRKVG